MNAIEELILVGFTLRAIEQGIIHFLFKQIFSDFIQIELDFFFYFYFRQFYIF